MRTYAIFRSPFEYEDERYTLAYFESGKIRQRKYSKKGLLSFIRNDQKSLYLTNDKSLELLIETAKLPARNSR